MPRGVAGSEHDANAQPLALNNQLTASSLMCRGKLRQLHDYIMESFRCIIQKQFSIVDDVQRAMNRDSGQRHRRCSHTLRRRILSGLPNRVAPSVLIHRRVCCLGSRPACSVEPGTRELGFYLLQPVMAAFQQHVSPCWLSI